MTVKVRCYLCGGDGKSSTSKTCGNCKGTGRREVSEEEGRRQLLQQQLDKYDV